MVYALVKNGITTRNCYTYINIHYIIITTGTTIMQAYMGTRPKIFWYFIPLQGFRKLFALFQDTEL